MTAIGGLSLLAIATAGLASAAAAQSGFPVQDESLRYAVNWPSGLSLGEATLAAHRSGGGWNLEMTLEAGIPGFRITDRFHSSTKSDLCSQEFEREFQHGGKKTSERSIFDDGQGVVHRTTLNGGGTTDLPIPTRCAWDALAFVYVARRALAQGAVQPPAQVYFGSTYSVRLEYTGAQTITVAEKPEVTDRIAVKLKGPASNTSFDIFFARDPARTPVSIRVPVSVGTLSLELVR